jgi:hypothetical protein
MAAFWRRFVVPWAFALAMTLALVWVEMQP